MRGGIKILIFASFAITAASSCKKHINNTPPVTSVVDPPVISPGFSAQMNNVKWTATINYARTTHTCMSCPLDSGLDIKAFDSGTKYMQISINHWNGNAGIYNQPGISDKNQIYFVYNPNDTEFPGKVFWSVSGNLIITKLSPQNVQGTFRNWDEIIFTSLV